MSGRPVLGRVHIRKIDGVWTSRRPSYGLNPLPDVRKHRSWKAATDSLKPRPGTPIVELERRQTWDWWGPGEGWAD